MRAESSRAADGRFGGGTRAATRGGVLRVDCTDPCLAGPGGGRPSERPRESPCPKHGWSGWSVNGRIFETGAHHLPGVRRDQLESALLCALLVLIDHSRGRMGVGEKSRRRRRKSVHARAFKCGKVWKDEYSSPNLRPSKSARSVGPRTGPSGTAVVASVRRCESGRGDRSASLRFRAVFDRSVSEAPPPRCPYRDTFGHSASEPRPRPHRVGDSDDRFVGQVLGRAWVRGRLRVLYLGVNCDDVEGAHLRLGSARHTVLAVCLKISSERGGRLVLGQKWGQRRKSLATVVHPVSLLSGELSLHQRRKQIPDVVRKVRLMLANPAVAHHTVRSETPG